MTKPLRRRHRVAGPLGRRTVAAALATTVVLPVGPPEVAGAESARDRLKAVRDQRARAGEEITALQTTEDALNESLDRADADVAEARRAARRAERAATLAEAEVQRIQAEVEQVTGQVDRLRQRVRDTAVRAFMAGPAPGATEALLLGGDIAEAGRARELVDAVTARDGAAIDELQAAEEELQVLRHEADNALVRARARREEATRQLAALRQRRDRQAREAASVEDRIAERLSEAEALARIDRGLADQIQAEQEALASRLAEQPGATGSSRPSEPASAPGEAPAVAMPAPPRGGLVSVGGIVVSARLADSLRSLLVAAASAGMSFGGGGYRDPSEQVRLRRQNCGSSQYALYVMPPSQCSPPTARPGSSLHEQGLAIDFTYAGSGISSRSNPGFRWLASYASRFGLRNLPSEPWHWSTTGQ